MRSTATGCGLAAAALLIAGAASAAEPPPLPADPATLARARAIPALPCAGGPVPGLGAKDFAAQDEAPAAWRVAGATVSVRLAGSDRFAFVLGPPAAGAATCPVRDVIVLPRYGMLLQCGLPDHSTQGMGVHGKIAGGRRDVLFWRGDGSGGLHRPGADEAGLESDTGELICSLPDAMP